MAKALWARVAKGEKEFTKVEFKVVYNNGSFAEETFDSLEEAREYQKNGINKQKPDSEYYDYWEKVKSETSIVEVESKFTVLED